MAESSMIQRQRLTDLVVERLMDWIMDGTLSMGEKLKADKIAQELGVSRMPVREALSMLEQLGLAEAVPYVGYQLVELDDANVHEIYLMRQMLEPETAYYACLHIDDDGIAELASINQTLCEVIEGDTIDPKLIHSLNRNFHFAMYQYSNMDRLVSTIKSLWDSLSFYKIIYGKQYINDKKAADDMIHTHEEMISALRDRNPNRVRSILMEDLRHHTANVSTTISSMMKTTRKPASVAPSQNHPTLL